MNWQAVAFDWNQIRAFLATVEAGSLSAAARALGVTQPTLSRQVAALERDLGVLLFERVGRSLSLTGAGRELLSHVRAMSDAAGRISIAAAGHSQAIEGLVRITASDLYAAHLLPQILQRLFEVAPGIQVEVVASNEVNDLMRREADIAIRHVRPDQPDLVARRCPDSTAHIYAATSYLDRAGRPTAPRDLDGAPFIGFTNRNDAIIGEMAKRGIHLTEHNFKWLTLNGVVAWEMVRQGLGYGVMMRDIAAVSPEVETVLPALEPIPVPTWLATHRELHTSRRIRLVFDLLGEMLS